MGLPRTFANFNGANGDDLTTDYPAFTYGHGSFGIFSNCAVPATASTENLAFVGAETFAADHVAEGVINIQGSRRKGVGVRLDALGNGYAYYGHGSSYGDRQLIREDAGVPTQLAIVGNQFSALDTIRLEAVGTGLTAKRNGSTDMTATDSTYSSGKPGLSARDSSDFAQMKSLVVDNIGGGGAADPFPPVPNLPPLFAALLLR